MTSCVSHRTARATPVHWAAAAAALVFALAQAPRLAAQDTPAPENGAEAAKQQPGKTEIRADQVDMDLKAGQAVFEGNVLVSDGKMMLESERMIVNFTEDNKLTRIEATGSVVITQPQGDRRATAGRATYDVETGEVVLTENPTLRIGEHSLQDAEQIVYHRDEQRFSTRGRVKVQFVPGEEGGNIELFEPRKPNNTD